MSRISAWTTVKEAIFILFGLLIMAGGFGRNGRWYLILIGIGLVGRSLIRIFTEIEDSSRGGKVDRMSKEREEIRKRMKRESQIIDLKWIILYAILGALILFGAVAYLWKVKAAKKTLVLAEEAKAKGDEQGALGLFVQALWLANEKPELETSILNEIRLLYDRLKIGHDLGDYQKLVEQYRALSKKSSRKSLKEIVEVQKLKKELLEKMPGYIAAAMK